MTFGTVIIVVLVGYAIYYGGMIIHDLFFDKRDVVEAVAIEEEEIDISDEAEGFRPIEVSKDDIRPAGWQGNNNEEDDEMTMMNGGIEIDELLAGSNDLALNGEYSKLGQLCCAWSISR